ncbi:MAG: hypothetical protein IJ087_22450 [Eggerthellaceae bacterium]|nr:hypothetical protein [Eggerthellaceae bacterium]
MNVYDFDGTIFPGDCSIGFGIWCMNRHPVLWLTQFPRTVWAFVQYKRGKIENYQLQCTLFSYLTKVDCGVVGVRLNRQSGLCPKCTELMHLNEEIAFNEILQEEREAATSEAAIAGIRRERDKMRQRNSRMCRKYGLKSRRERGYGES